VIHNCAHIKCFNDILIGKRKSRPISRVLSRAAIHLGCKSPCSSSNLPRNRAGHAYIPLFDLAPSGVYRAAPVTSCAVRSYRTFSPLPSPFCKKLGGIFSVALSVGLHLPGVTWHPAQWSPDFPPFYLAIKQRLLSRLFLRRLYRKRELDVEKDFKQKSTRL
jgi:hypothetical protein